MPVRRVRPDLDQLREPGVAETPGLVYAPTATFRIAVAISAILFLTFAAISAVTGQATWVVVTLAGCTLLGVLGIVESLIASVEVRTSEVAVRSLLGEKRFPFSVIEEVRLEGGQVHLKIRGAAWEHMPPWLPGRRAMSLRAQIARKLKAEAAPRPNP